MGFAIPPCNELPLRRVCAAWEKLLTAGQLDLPLIPVPPAPVPPASPAPIPIPAPAPPSASAPAPVPLNRLCLDDIGVILLSNRRFRLYLRIRPWRIDR